MKLKGEHIMKKHLKPLSVLLVVALLLSISALFASAGEAAPHYVVLGDSIGWGAGVMNSDEACFGRIVANTNGYDFTRLAVNGDRSGDLLRHLGEAQYIDAVSKADIISISIGGNDFLGNMILLLPEGTLGIYKRFDALADEMRSNFSQSIEIIRSLNPDVQILVHTLYNPGNFLVRATYQQATNRINGIVRSYLEDHPGAYVIIDVASAFGSDLSYVAADTIHPSAKGNVKIAELTLKALYDLGLGEKTEPVILQEGVDQIETDPRLLLKAVKLWVQFLFRLVTNTL